MTEDTPEQGEGGRWQARVTLEQVLDVFDRVAGPPVITAKDVAEHCDCSGDTARNKLGTLYDQGQVAKRTAGRPTLWWRTADFEEGESGE